MTAYDVAAWTDFASTVAGGAAALAGLLFVGLSLNLSDVLKYPGVPARAASTLGVTVAILLTAIFVATPGQDDRALAAEIGVLGLVTAVGVGAGLRQQRSGEHRVRAVTSTLLLGVPALLLIAAAFSLWLQCGGGLYWVTAAVAMVSCRPRPMRGYCWSRSDASFSTPPSREHDDEHHGARG